MYLERLVFQAKYGTDLVSALRKANEYMAQRDVGQGRILTDLTGKMFTMIWEFQVPDLQQWDNIRREMFQDPDFPALFAEMMAITESGHQEFYNIEEEGKAPRRRGRRRAR